MSSLPGRDKAAQRAAEQRHTGTEAPSAVERMAQIDSTATQSWLVCNEFCQAKEHREERKNPQVYPRPQLVTGGQDWADSNLKLQWAEQLQSTALQKHSEPFSQGTQHLLLHL